MITLEIPVDSDVELGEAKRLAVEGAAAHVEDPMVLAWLDKHTGAFSPDIECCCDGPPWQVYAESRGASVRVEVGDQFTFLLREGLAG